MSASDSFSVFLHTTAGVAATVASFALPFALGGVSQSDIAKYYSMITPAMAIYSNYRALKSSGYSLLEPASEQQQQQQQQQLQPTPRPLPAFLVPQWLFPRDPSDARYTPKAGFSRKAHYVVLCVLLRVLEPYLVRRRRISSSAADSDASHPGDGGLSSEKDPRVRLQGISGRHAIAALPALAVAELLQPWVDTQLRMRPLVAAIFSWAPTVQCDLGLHGAHLTLGLLLSMLPDTSRVPFSSWVLLVSGVVGAASTSAVAVCGAPHDPVLAFSRWFARVSDACNSSVLLMMIVGCLLSSPAKTVAELGWAPIVVTAVTSVSTFLSHRLARTIPLGTVGERLALLLDTLTSHTYHHGFVLESDGACRLAVAAVAAAPPALRAKLDAALVDDETSPMAARSASRGLTARGPEPLRYACAALNIGFPAVLFATVVGNPQVPVALQAVAAFSTVLTCASVAVGWQRIVHYRRFHAATLRQYNDAAVATRRLVPFITRVVSPSPGAVLRSLAGIRADVLPADVLDDAVGPYVGNDLTHGVSLAAAEQLANL